MSERYSGGVIFNAPGGWSAQFSGSNYLSVANNSALDLGTGDYTIEGWWYFTDTSNQALISKYSSGQGFVVQYQSSNLRMVLGLGGGSDAVYAFSWTPVINTWYHIAITRSGTSGRAFVNGSQIGSTTTFTTSNTTSSTTLQIGLTHTVSEYTRGNASNVRLVKGTAVYTANFTAPTGALLPITNTTLLTCRYPTFVDGSTNAFTITNTGTVTVNTANPFPTSATPNPALGVAGNGIYTLSQYAALKTANLWPAIDPYYENVTFNLHGNAGTVLPFNTDASTNNFQVTQLGDTRPSNYTPFIENGYWSNFFNGSSSYLSFASNAAFAVTTTADYTVEGWINFSTVAAGGVFQTTSNPTSNTGALWFGYYSGNLTVAQHGSATYNVSYAWTPTAGVWYHVAATRTSGTVRLFINGALVRTDASTQNGIAFTQAGAAIGLVTTPSYLTGYLSNVRYVNGSSLYTAAFTPSTTPLTAVTNTVVLTCQSNRFIDNSSNAFTITTNGSPSVNPLQPFTAPTGTSAYGSGYFDGTGDYLRAPTGYLTSIGTGNFTIEGWWNFGDFTVRTTYFQRLWSFGTGLANDVTLNVDTSGNLVFRINDSIIASQSAGAMKLNSWNHVALVRSSGTVTIYLNGTSVGSAANSTNLSTQASNPFYLGCESDGAGGYFYGYCSNVRITNTAVYTTTFTPSTTPLTAISGTSLLTVQTNAPSQNNTFLDSSTNNFVITRNGNTTQGTFSPYGSTWSNYFDGSGDYLTIGSSGGTAIGTSDFTLEFWVYMTNSSVTQIDFRPSSTNGAYISFGWISGAPGTATIDYYVNSNSRITASVGPTLNAWSHIAICRVSGSTRVFIDGTQVGSTWADSTNYLASNANIWWNAFLGARPGTGYFSNYRLVLSGLYSANFTPPTAPLTAISGTQFLTCQSNRFKDNSSNNYALTPSGDVSVQRFSPFSPTSAYTTSVIGGSGYFDGSGDYLQSPSSSSVSAWSTDFTVEGWYYPTVINAGSNALWTNSTSNSDGMTYGYIRSDGSVALGRVGVNETSSAAGVIKINSWFHIAFVRNGGSVNIYVNGVSVATPSTGNLETTTTKPITVGGEFQSGGGDFNFTGYIADFRVVKGTAVYTSTFTPPTAPLTAIANTSLLLNYTNAAIFDNAMMNDLETVGNAQISTSVKKFGTGSMYFDGSGDGLTANGVSSSGAYNQLTASGVVNTVEFWLYLNAFTSPRAFLCGSWASSVGWTYDVNTSGDIFISVNGAGPTVTLSSKITTGAWQHLAFVNDGTNIKIYLNGTNVGTQAVTAPSSYIGPLTIGLRSDSSLPLNGYIDDLRITKGVARYTTSFTPPTSQLQDQ